MLFDVFVSSVISFDVIGYPSFGIANGERLCSFILAIKQSLLNSHTGG